MTTHGSHGHSGLDANEWRTITKCLKSEFVVLGSNYQLCLGQKCGIEYAIHTLRKQYEKTDSDAILLIDAENAFNSLNRKLALKTLQIYALPKYPQYSTHTLIHPNST